MLAPVLSLEGLLCRVGRSGSEGWLEVVSGAGGLELAPLLEGWLVLLGLAVVLESLGVELEGLLCNVGRSGS